jgi:hypothetical protein
MWGGLQPFSGCFMVSGWIDLVGLVVAKYYSLECQENVEVEQSEFMDQYNL